MEKTTKYQGKGNSYNGKKGHYTKPKNEKKTFSDNKFESHKKYGKTPRREQSLIVKRGDVYFADMGEGSGSEQSGVRPVVILQNDIGNKFSSTVIVACITSQIEKAKLPTHVEVGVRHGLKKESVVLLEQIRTIDKDRLTDKITAFNTNVMKEVDRAMMISLGLA
jgi:mRNA interferase MazF